MWIAIHQPAGFTRMTKIQLTDSFDTGVTSFACLCFTIHFLMFCVPGEEPGSNNGFNGFKPRNII